jgi:hypothetical protein
LLDRRIHLLIVDLHPPARFDPADIRGAIWACIAGETYSPSVDKPLTLAAYEAGSVTTTFVAPVAVGRPRPDMPLFLQPGNCVFVRLERSQQTAWEALPRRWKSVLEP